MQTNENHKKLRKEIIAVIAVAALCLIIAAAFVVQYAVRTYNEEKAISEFSESFGAKLEGNHQKAEDIKGLLNPEIVGTYQSAGDVSEKDTSQAVAYMQLLPDAKVIANSFAGENLNGWWTSSPKDGVDFLAVGIDGKQEVILYQKSGTYLMDVKSLYYGEIEKSPAFDTTLINESAIGKMTLELDSKGVARGNFLDNNENSENYGVNFALKGTYNVDGDFINITLNGAMTRFLMFDYGMKDADRDSGMASVYFEKIK